MTDSQGPWDDVDYGDIDVDALVNVDAVGFPASDERVGRTPRTNASDETEE